MSKYVYSTLSADVKYMGYRPAPANGADYVPVGERSVIIKGDAGIANKHLVTPYGAVTEVSDEEMQFLETQAVFRRHRDRGYIKVEDRKHEVDSVVADMTGRDNSAPLVDADFAEGQGPVPTANAEPQRAHTQHASTKRQNEMRNTNKR